MRPTDPSRAWPPIPESEHAERRLLAAVECCRFRATVCNCMAKPAICLMTGEPASVSLDDCRSCPIIHQKATP